MRYFTDSPYERMMMEIPRAGHSVTGIAGETGCGGCGYVAERSCLTVCMRDLAGSGRERHQRKAAQK